jgi:hypothetical protein
MGGSATQTKVFSSSQTHCQNHAGFSLLHVKDHFHLYSFRSSLMRSLWQVQTGANRFDVESMLARPEETPNQEALRLFTTVSTDVRSSSRCEIVKCL